jgi:hypothetical protein
MKTTASLLLAAMSTTFAGAPADAILETPAPASGWEFRASPYGWLPGMDGTLGVRGLTTDVDVNFIEDDLIDYLDMAAALQFEARHGRWGIIADGFYAKLGTSGTPPGPLYDEVKASYKEFLGELDFAYRVYEDPRVFVDVYAGVRYTKLSVELSASESPTGVATFSDNVSNRIGEGALDRAAAIVEPRLAEYESAAAATRTDIENDVAGAVEAATERRVRRELKREIENLRRDSPGDRGRFNATRLAAAVAKDRAALARSAAQLKVAELRASVDASLQNKVDLARARVSKAQAGLSKSINNAVSEQLTTGASGDEDWIDPVLGIRAQWNINDKWFLAGKGDIGGFSVGCDLTWSIQATAGYHFTPNVSAELGYRCLFQDYQNGGFTNDLVQAGLYTGLNIRF